MDFIIFVIGFLSLLAIILPLYLHIVSSRKENEAMMEPMIAAEREMGYEIIPIKKRQEFLDMKEVILSFKGFRDLSAAEIRLHQLARGKFNDETISLLNTIYHRNIEDVSVEMKQSFIIIASKHLDLPEFSLRSALYWRIYHPTGAYGLGESPYYNNYKPIFSEEELKKLDDADPFARLDRRYMLSATDKERKKLRKIITTAFIDILEPNPFMMIEGNRNHLLFMDGIGYTRRILHSLDEPNEEVEYFDCLLSQIALKQTGFMRGAHTAEKIKNAIDLARQLKNT